MDAKHKNNCHGYWNTEVVKELPSLDNIKKQLHRTNCSYLCRHPELRAIIRVFLHELINKQPENIFEFSSALFSCNNALLLVTKINQQLKRVNEQMSNSQWSQCDGEMFFSEMNSNHSLLSTSSMGIDIDNMLRYAMILRDEQ